MEAERERKRERQKSGKLFTIVALSHCFSYPLLMSCFFFISYLFILFSFMIFFYFFYLLNNLRFGFFSLFFSCCFCSFCCQKRCSTGCTTFSQIVIFFLSNSHLAAMHASFFL